MASPELSVPRLFLIDALGLAYRAFHAILTRRPKTPAELAADTEEERARAAAEGRAPKAVNPVKWEPLKNSRGEPTNAIYGFANSVLKVRREEPPDYWALCWDGPGPTFRHERYEGYKATRKPMPDDLLVQMPAVEDMAQALGLPVLEIPGVEADDVMASIACRAEAEGFDTVLVTSDKDMLQIVTERVKIWKPMRSGDDYTWIDRASIEREWGVPPERLRDVLALMGDSIDNVPGVPGVGEKTAAELIKTFGSIDALYERLAEVKRPALREKLAAHHESLLLSRELVTVKRDCDIPWEWETLRRGPIRRNALTRLARRYELVRLERIAAEEGVEDAEAGPAALTRAPGRRRTAAEPPEGGEAFEDVFIPPARASVPAESPVPRPAPARPAERAAAVQQATLDLFGRAERGEASREDAERRMVAVRAAAAQGLALLPVLEGGEPRLARLVGVAVAARDGASAYLPLAHAQGANAPAEAAHAWLAELLGDPAVPKIGEDLKRDAHALAAAGLPFEGLAFDVHVGSFLCDPERDHSLGALAHDSLGVTLPPFEALALGARTAEAASTGEAAPRSGKRIPASSLAPEIVGAWAERVVGVLIPLADALGAQLEARQQSTLYRTLEHPLIPVLLDMERAGVALEPQVLGAMRATAADEIARLEEELFALAGERFNLNSGPQLGRVLFEKLGMKTGRRTKTGFSTDQAVLEELAESHAFPARLLEYRALSKLQSTYLDSLPQMIDPRDGRVHTTYNQAGAATGRLSSSNPNLQNIPMRTELGRAIRKAFVAPPGRVLVGADYSQIELRVMAHLSGDPNLIEAFESGEDVHASTARRVFGVTGPLDPALRSRAKVVNFGVMYGMGARSLSQQMGISLKEAQDFIASYFRAYAGVRAYLDRTLAEARARGWVETLFGRRRYLPALADTQGAARAFAERAAINAPIQGSAADLMKLAMIRVHGALKHHHPSARLLLQVHDELVLECARDDADAVAQRVRQEMEGCHPMRVPLEVSVGRGATWFDVH